MNKLPTLDLTNMSDKCEFGPMSPEEEAEMEAEYRSYVKDRHDLELALAEGRISQETFDQFTDDFK